MVRRALRDPVRAGALRPRLRAGPRWGDGELGLRDLRRLGPAPQHADVRRAPRDRRGGAARDGPHVVRRPGHDAVVGRPVAQRGLRLLGGLLGGRGSHALRRRLGHLPRRREAGRLPPRHGTGHPPDPRRRPRRGAGDGELRRHLLLQGPSGAEAARRVRRRRRFPGGAARLLPRPRVGQHDPPGPHRRDRHVEWTRPRRVGGGLARPSRHRHARAVRRHPDRRRSRRRLAAPAPPRHRLLRRHGRWSSARRRRAGAHQRTHHEGRAAGLRPAAGQRPRPHVRRRPDRPAVARPDARPRRGAPGRRVPERWP